MKLIVIKNNKLIQTLELDPEIGFKQEFLVGRAPHCHIVLSEPGLSREHGKFILENKNLSYKTLDTNSSNVSNYSKLANNQVINISDFTIKVLLEQEEKKIEPITEVKAIAPKAVEETVVKKNEDFYNSQNDLMLGSEMLAETMKLTEKSISTNNNSNFGTEHKEEEPNEMFDKFEPIENKENQNNEQVSLPMESNDPDATRVMTDFIKYSLILKGNGIPFEKYVISKAVTSIGRSSQNDIVLTDHEVSSQHAKLILRNNILFLEDQGSVNGIFVNGQKVNKHQLVEGDTFTICSVGFAVKVESDFIEAEKDILMPVEVLEDSTQEINLQESLAASENTSSNFSKGKKVSKKSSLNDFIQKLPLGELKNNPKRLALYAVMSVLLVILLLPESEENDKPETIVKENPTKDTNTSKDQTLTTTQGDVNKQEPVKPVVPERSPEELNYLKSHYALAMSYLEKGDYASAISEIDLVMSVDPEYKDIASLQGLAKDGLAKIEEQERKRKEEEERIARKKEIDELLSKLETALNEKNLTTADVLISQIFELDPDNMKVSTLKIQLESIKEDIRRKAEEEALRKELRRKMVASLAPGKSFFLQKEWYKAIIKLQDFLSSPGMDEDLITEATTMLQQAKTNLEDEISVPLNNARQYKSAQDLKNAYEQYYEVLKIDPGNDEANLAAREIKDTLMIRARVIYREALVSESISQFKKAKEKFQEVLLIAPSDSDYYKKAEDKLKKIYLE